MYLFSSSGGCYLGIQPLNFPFMILGDVFLRHNTVIFNKIENTIGFIDNYRKIDLFVANKNYLYVFDFL